MSVSFKLEVPDQSLILFGRFVHLLLLTAERAWVHAMHMKSLHSEDNAGRGITGSTRSHIISRLNKAAKCARKLAELLADQAASGATDHDVLEARAYAYSLSGAEEFEKQAEGVRSSDAQAQKQRWELCLANFAAARVSYDALLRATKKDLFKEILASTVDPSIRYAAYQSHLPRTIAIAAVARQYFPRNDSELVNALEKLDTNALRDEGTTPGKEIPSNPQFDSIRATTLNSLLTLRCVQAVRVKRRKTFQIPSRGGRERQT